MTPSPLLILLLALGTAANASEDTAAIRPATASTATVTAQVAVLAHRGEDKARRRWQATLDYLGDHIPGYRFELIPLRLKELIAGVAANRFDFVLTNPGQYVELEAGYGITRLATLINLRQGRPYNKFGSVIFTRADHPDIHQLADIRGQRFAGVGKQAFGGFQLAWYELLRAGVDPFEDTQLVFTGIPQDAVVYAVRDRDADAGTVRTDVLERMASEGLIDLKEFRLLQPRKVEQFPFLLSTGLYPEWAFARSTHTDEDLARRVAVALLSLPAEAPAARAGRYAGWQVPGNYNPIHQVYKAIHYGPYQHYGQIGLVELLRRYWPMLLLVALLLLLALYHVVTTRRMNRCLMLAKERAESANLAKGTFLANMSHEIRTPLNGVLGYAQVLQRADDIPDKYRPQLNAINDAGNHLLSLLNDILDLSRIEAGADQLATEEFSLARLVDGLVGVFRMRCRDQDLVLTVNADLDSTRLVIGDPGKLRQVLYNLLGNAVKFTSHGEVRLSVQQQQDTTHFVVEDTGKGIAPEDLARIFDPFKQSEQGLRQGGTGLGLNISRRYVELLGGRLQVDSKPGQGARFTFSIPLRVTNIGYHDADQAYGETRYRLAEGQQLVALVVDDVAINRSVMAQILGDAGVEVDCAENGRQALEAIAARRPDIVWMDLRMPEMGGREAVAAIRERYGNDIRCVAVSASAPGAPSKGTMEQRFDGLLPKPYSMEQLFSLIEELLPLRFERQAPQPRDTGSDTILWSQLSEPHRAALSEVAAAHQVTALKRELAAMRDGNTADQVLAARLQPLLARFDMDAVRQLIEDLQHG